MNRRAFLHYNAKTCTGADFTHNYTLLEPKLLLFEPTSAAFQCKRVTCHDCVHACAHLSGVHPQLSEATTTSCRRAARVNV